MSNDQERHYKCDETKPTCLRCIKADRPCSYELETVIYSPPEAELLTPPKSPGLGPEQPLVALHGDELRGLGFYIQRVAPMMDHRYPEFWCTMLPQVATGNSRVRDALIAMSEVYEQGTGRLMSTAGIRRYNSAIKGLLRNEPGMGLDLTPEISCLLFISIEAMQGKLPVATRLAESGQKMLYKNRSKVATDSEAMIFDELELSFRTLLRQVDSVTNRVPKRTVPEAFPMKPAKQAGSIRVHNLNDAVNAISSLALRWIYSRDDPHRGEKLDADLDKWMKEYKALPPGRSPTHIMPLIAVKHFEILRMFGEKAIEMDDSDQMQFDRCIDVFEYSVSLAETIDFSAPGPLTPWFSYGRGISLYMNTTAIRCRDPVIRRRAIKILKKAGRQEGILRSEWLLQIPLVVMHIEEHGRIVKTASEVPAEARISKVRINWESDDGPLKLHLLRQDGWIIHDLT